MSWLGYLRMVLWSFFGIRRGAAADDEARQARPVLLVVAAIAVAALLVLGLIALAMFAATAAAQPPSLPPPAAAAGPAASIPAGNDDMADRVRPCTVCHGREGRATADGYFPRIAGKPEGYLYNQLVHFQNGTRRNAAMAHLVEHMTPAYLREIAAWFAALDLPYPPAAIGSASPATLARGARLARQGDPANGIPPCSDCHGDRLTGVQPALPGLLGLPRDYLQAQLGAWRTGQREAAPPDCMAAIAKRLDAEDVVAVASWLAAQAPPRGAEAKPAPRLARPLPIACGSGGGGNRSGRP